MTVQKEYTSEEKEERWDKFRQALRLRAVFDAHEHELEAAKRDLRTESRKRAWESLKDRARKNAKNLYA